MVKKRELTVANFFASAMDRADSPSFSPSFRASLRRFAGMLTSSSLSDESSFSDEPSLPDPVPEELFSSTKCLLGCLHPTDGLWAEGGVEGEPSTDCPWRLGSIADKAKDDAVLWSAGVGVFLRGCPGVKGICGDMLRARWVDGRSGEELGSSASHDWDILWGLKNVRKVFKASKKKKRPANDELVLKELEGKESKCCAQVKKFYSSGLTPAGAAAPQSNLDLREIS